jgi:hypothetical protein
MDQTARITQLEDEFKVLKNEVLAVLLDVKEKMLSQENPFSAPPACERPQVIISQQMPAASPAPAAAPAPAESSERHAREPEPAAVRHTGNGHAQASLLPSDTDRFEDSNENSKPETHMGFANNKKEEILKPFWIPEERQETGEPETDKFNGAVAFATLGGMIKWVETTAGNLGADRTRTILDVSEMMGQMPGELRNILEKMIPAEIIKHPPQKIYARDYLNALKDLAKLLGSKNTADFVALHIVSHGLTSMTRSGQDG